MVKKRGQASFEYLILMGFVTLVLSTVLGIAFIYTNSVEDRLKITQMNNFANKVVSAAEYVYSSGEPSKATIIAYLPEGVSNVTIQESTLVITIQISSGKNIIGFPSEVNITGDITESPGLKKIEVVAETNGATINSV